VPPTATPVPATATAVPLTATPVPPTATTLTLASLSGKVDPPASGIRVALMPLFPDTTTAEDGTFRIRDIPPGDYSAYAIGSNGQSGDPVSVHMAGEVTVNLRLTQFTGQPNVYMGKVVGANGTPVNDAVVWRLGGAGRATSDSNGKFSLVDAFGDLNDHLSPVNVTFIATSGDRWGYQYVDFSKESPKPEIKLTHQGNAPRPPDQLLNVRNLGSGASGQVDGGRAVYFTALWDVDNTAGRGEVKLDPLPPGDRPNGVQNQQCKGDCGNWSGNLRVIKLPTQGKVTVGIVASQSGAPNWVQAQVVALR